MYFKLDLDGQLNEYQDQKAMGSTVLALSIAEVLEGRQRTPYFVSAGKLLVYVYALVIVLTMS